MILTHCFLFFASYIGFNDQSLIITVHWWGITPMTHNSWSPYKALLTLEIAIVDCLQKSMTRSFISWPSVHQQSIDSWSIEYTARTEGDSSINTSQDTLTHLSTAQRNLTAVQLFSLEQARSYHFIFCTTQLEINGVLESHETWSQTLRKLYWVLLQNSFLFCVIID